MNAMYIRGRLRHYNYTAMSFRLHVPSSPVAFPAIAEHSSLRSLPKKPFFHLQCFYFVDFYLGYPW